MPKRKIRIRIYARAAWNLDAQTNLVRTLDRSRPDGYLPDARERVVGALKTAGLNASGTEDSDGGVVLYVLQSEWCLHSRQIGQTIRAEFPR